MNRIFALFFAALAATPSLAQEAQDIAPVDAWTADRSIVLDATVVSLADFVWIARPVVVFADTPNDPRLQQQLDLLAAFPEDLALRDVVILVDSDPDADGAAREQLRPRGFMIALLGKDGEVELRKPQPWDVRELRHAIDRMPLRQHEIDERRLSN